MNMTDIKLEELLGRIYYANEAEINPIIDAITARFAEVWPEWELLMLTVHGHINANRIEALQKSIKLLSHNIKNDLP